MSLADSLAKVAPKPGAQQCLTCHWYTQQSDDDKQAFDDWVAAGWRKSQLLDACRREGLDVVDSSFSRHISRCHPRILMERHGAR